MHATTAPAQTLAEDLNAFWILIQRTSSSQWFREIAEADLSLTQLKTLMALGADPAQRMPVKQLAGVLHLSEAATSRAADAMVRRGLLARTECAEDRRQRLLQLTADGAALRDRVIQARVAGLIGFVEGLEPAEQQALAAALSPIVQRLKT